MKITIDQEEIETAVTNHIKSLITVKDGQEISIDFKAGRGENGLSAEISIDAPVAKATTSKPTPRAPAQETAQVATQEVQETVAADLKPATQVAENAAQDVAEPAPVADAVQVEEPVTETAEQAPAEEAEVKPTGSLFAGLKRPQNT